MASKPGSRGGLPGGTGNLGFSRQLPASKRKVGGKQGLSGVIIVNTNAKAVQEHLHDVVTRAPTNLAAFNEQRAADIQGRMRSEMASAYPRGTGRASRGIFAKVKNSKQSDTAVSVIRVTAINYREMRFLTNIGGSGHFKSYPVEPYTIFAKGASQADFEDINSATGEVRANKSKSRISFIRRTSGRLKVPRRGSFFTTERRSTGPAESRIINDALGPADPGDALGAFFFYPLWVNHPGFARDIPAEIALSEGARYITDTKEIVSVSHQSTITTSLESQMAVSAEIPITSIYLSRK